MFGKVGLVLGKVATFHTGIPTVYQPALKNSGTGGGLVD
jgi:hypothetical protein